MITVIVNTLFKMISIVHKDKFLIVTDTIINVVINIHYMILFMSSLLYVDTSKVLNVHIQVPFERATFLIHQPNDIIIFIILGSDKC